MRPSTTASGPARSALDLRRLVGRGDRIALFAVPFVLAGAALQMADPAVLAVDGSSTAVRAIAILTLAVGLLGWVWSVGLILWHVPRGELIKSGPYAVAKRPLYTSVALLVLPAIGILLDTWLGAIIGVAVYAGSRLFSPAEEAQLRQQFGTDWDAYARSVWLPWL
jgi:protein-S-isoprenylcysteine O-methyltransferase Ste14